ncbi:hypothetical protein ABZ746_15470 [Streptomyces sp. NPDC020096]
MAQVYEAYRDAVRDVWGGWWLAWPLSQRVAVGDVLRSLDGSVRSAGTLQERRVEVRLTAPGAPGEFTYDAGGAAELRFKAAGSADAAFSSVAVGDAGALVRFGRSAGTLIAYRGLTQTGLTDVGELAAALLRLYWKGDWDDGMLAVTDVVHAESSTVLVASEAGATAELRLSATAGTGPLRLADLAGGAALTRGENLGLRWLADDVTPFYRLVRIRRKWLGGVRAEFGPPQPGRGFTDLPVPPVLLEEAQDDPDVLLEPVPPGEQPPPTGECS